MYIVTYSTTYVYSTASENKLIASVKLGLAFYYAETDSITSVKLGMRGCLLDTKRATALLTMSPFNQSNLSLAVGPCPHVDVRAQRDRDVHACGVCKQWLRGRVLDAVSGRPKKYRCKTTLAPEECCDKDGRVERSCCHRHTPLLTRWLHQRTRCRSRPYGGASLLWCSTERWPQTVKLPAKRAEKPWYTRSSRSPALQTWMRP